MRIQVLLSSGEKDGWREAADAVIVDGFLHVLQDIEGEIRGETKTYDVIQTIHRPAMPDMVKGTTYQLLATYAPSMWMKVEFA